MRHDRPQPLPMIGIDLGLCPYRKAWDLQQELHRRVCANPDEAYILKVEHPAVLTLGKHASGSNLLLPVADYKAAGVEVVEVDRGGEVTAHNPGQMVIYPILSVRRFGLTPKRYIQLLERILIELLSHFGIKANVDSQYPGVWVNNEKICAVGVRIKDRVTMHGLALNVCNDLGLFEKIVPCGISNRQVTSIGRLGKPADIELVFREFVRVWQNRVGELKFMRNIEELFGA